MDEARHLFWDLGSDRRGYWFAGLMVLLATVTRSALGRVAGPLPPFLTFYPAVLLVTSVSGRGPGLLATAVSTLVADYFFVAPVGSLAVTTPADAIALTIFMGTNIALCLLIDRLQRQRLSEAVEGQRAVLAVQTLSAREHTERALRESRATLDAALASMTDAVFVSDVAGRFVHFNEAFATFHRFSSKDACAQTLAEYPGFLEVYLPDGTLAPLESWAVPRALRGETAMNAEYGLRRKDTGQAWVGSYNFSPIRNSAGTILGSVVTARDVTAIKAAERERKRLFDELHAEKERLSAVLDGITDEVWFADTQGRFTLANPAALREFGYSGVDGLDMQRLTSGLVVLRADGTPRPMSEAPPIRALRGEILRDEEEIVLTPATGAMRHRRVSSSPVRDRQGRVIGAVSIVRDVTDRKRADEQFRLAIEAAPTGMLLTDAAGKIVLVNAQIEKMFGFSRKELLGADVEILVPARDRADHPGLRRGFFAEPVARSMGTGRELFGLCKDGREIPVEIGINPLRVAGDLLVLSSVTDISDRRQAIDRLNALNAELQSRVLARTAELRERDAMLQEIHHRVKNNLQVISSLIHMQGRAMRDEPTRIALQECRSRVETMAEIHAMLYQSKDYARIPFSRYARELATRVMRASEIAPSAIRLDFELEEIFLTVDKAIPCGLIVNELVSNALKHAFPNAREGTIRLELKGAPEHRIVLGVADDGIGMPADFEPEKAKSLGVQLVVSLAQQLDGVIDIAREHGTAVRISFLPEASP